MDDSRKLLVYGAVCAPMQHPNRQAAKHYGWANLPLYHQISFATSMLIISSNGQFEFESVRLKLVLLTKSKFKDATVICIFRIPL